MKDCHARSHACRGLRPDVPDYTPEPFQALMRKCWAAVPATRPSFVEVADELTHMHDAISEH
jgi:Protein tyrosine and serine/threonine kinase